MRRLDLAVPTEYEDRVLAKLGQLGTVHLIREFQLARGEKTLFVDVTSRFDRLNEKLDAVLTEEVTRTLAEPVSEASTPKDLEEVLQSLEALEAKASDSLDKLQGLEKEIKELGMLEDKLTCLSSNGLQTDELGVFRHVFVRAGFMRSTLTTRLTSLVTGTSVVPILLPSGRPRENLVVVTGLNEDMPYADQVLKMLNFEEITFPKGLALDPKVAIEETRQAVKLKADEANQTKQALLEIKVKAGSLRPYVVEAAEYEEAKDSIIRTQTKSIFHGWIPRDKVDELKAQMEQVVPKQSLYMKFEEPRAEDTVPVEFKASGILKAFQMFTNLQGIPNYFEINPTLIYTILYVTMFGMMFGDVGGGLVLIIIGIVLTRLKSGFLAFSSNAVKQISIILIACGASAGAFGVIYGVFFLIKTPWPPLLSPLNNFEEILAIALAFGVAQIILSLILNIINMVRRKDIPDMILGGKGLIALIFYLSGVVAAYAFVQQRSLDAFFTGITSIFSSISILMLALIFLSPLIKSRLTQEGSPVLEKVLEGFGEALETFISFIANSVSYIRLAAFAIAHEAIGIAAGVLGTVLGSVASLVLLNVLDFLVEGFASFIQALRLMYYEFSTRFYLKNGIAYRPFKVGLIKMKI